MKNELLKIAQDLEQCIITENEARTILLGLLGISNSANTDTKELRASGFGIIVDKSKATKTYQMRGTPFPKGSDLNPTEI